MVLYRLLLLSKPKVLYWPGIRCLSANGKCTTHGTVQKYRVSYKQFDIKEQIIDMTTRGFFTTNNTRQVGYKLQNNVSDCYSLFNLPTDSSEEELRDAYLRLAKQYHPDSGTSTACPRKFHQIQEAYKAIKRDMNQKMEVVMEEEEGIEGEFDFPHTLPQHRQYLGNEGIGFGSPSQRQGQYNKYKVRRASELVTEFRMSKDIMQTETSALVVNKKQAKKNKISNTIDRIVEDLIQESMSKGEFDNLPGKGKPLDYTERNPMVDTMTHNINKILINNGYVPEWITLEKEIREDLTKARQRLAVERMKIGDVPIAVNDMKWLYHVKAFENSIRDLNDKIQKFNMIVPTSLIQKQMVPYTVNKEVKKVSERYSEYLTEDLIHGISQGSPVVDRYIASKEGEKINWKETWNDIKNSIISIRSSTTK